MDKIEQARAKVAAIQRSAARGRPARIQRVVEWLVAQGVKQPEAQKVCDNAYDAAFKARA